jgi:hypothetical protein
MSFASVLFFLALVRLAISGFVLEDDYSPENFFDMFSFFTDSDPTHGMYLKAGGPNWKSIR